MSRSTVFSSAHRVLRSSLVEGGLLAHGRPRGAMRWWKIAGLAAVLGVAATGVVVVRAERKRRSYTPNEIRARLHQRHQEALSR